MHQIKLSNGMELDLTDAQAKFAFCWVGKEGNLTKDPDTVPLSIREAIEVRGDCLGFHHDD